MLPKITRITKLTKKLRLRVTGYPGHAIPVFIFGEMRSGTNMLMDILSRCADAECYNETDEEAFRDYRIRDSAQIKKLIARSYAKVVCFKPTADSQIALDILNTYEHSKAIWIYRRYQDAVNSALKIWTQHNEYLHKVLYESESAGWRSENISNKMASMIEHYYTIGMSERSARALIWYVRNSMFFLQRLDRDKRVMLANYERIVRDPAGEFAKITNFLGITQCNKAATKVFSTSVDKEPFGSIDPEISQHCENLFAKLKHVHLTQWNNKSTGAQRTICVLDQKKVVQQHNYPADKR